MNTLTRISIVGLIALGCGQANAQEIAVKALQEQVDALRASILPAGTIIFVQTKECPKPFVEFIAARGRAIVGAPSSGTVGAQVGPEMSDREPRNKVAYHQHLITVPPHTHGIQGKNTFGYNEQPPSQFAGGHGYYLTIGTATTDPSSSQQIQSDFTGVQGEPALPYVQLRACMKT
jgi:hypothetical protein